MDIVFITSIAGIIGLSAYAVMKDSEIKIKQLEKDVERQKQLSRPDQRIVVQGARILKYTRRAIRK